MARKAILLLALALAIALGCVCCVSGADSDISGNWYVVGGAQRWTVNDPVPPTYFQDCADQYKFYVRDALNFVFTVGSTAVAPIQVSPANYASCRNLNITNGNVVYKDNGIFYTADLVTTGTTYYIDQDLASCQAGLKFLVNSASFATEEWPLQCCRVSPQLCCCLWYCCPHFHGHPRCLELCHMRDIDSEFEA